MIIEVEIDDAAVTKILIRDVDNLNRDIRILESQENLSEVQKMDIDDLKRYCKSIILALEFYLPYGEYRELLEKYKSRI